MRTQPHQGALQLVTFYVKFNTSLLQANVANDANDANDASDVNSDISGSSDFPEFPTSNLCKSSFAIFKSEKWLSEFPTSTWRHQEGWEREEEKK